MLLNELKKNNLKSVNKLFFFLLIVVLMIPFIHLFQNCDAKYFYTITVSFKVFGKNFLINV